jgi:hypothetical protein
MVTKVYSQLEILALSRTHVNRFRRTGLAGDRCSPRGQSGLELEQIEQLIDRLLSVSDTILTVNDIRHLVHGGRISHLKGLLASALKSSL